jgi:hypothetical protein
MKQVISSKNNKNIPVTILTDAINLKTAYFVAETIFHSKNNKETYTLEYEAGRQAEYIFRPLDVNDESGHSGFHATKLEAIEKLLEVPRTELFQFESIREMHAFLANKA